MDKNEQKLKRLLSLMDEDTLTKEDFVTYFEQVIEFVKKMREFTESEVESIKESLERVNIELKSTNSEQVSLIKENVVNTLNLELSKFNSKTFEKWQKIQDKLDSIRDGVDADEDRVVELATRQAVTNVMSQLPPPAELKLETADETVEKINTSSRLIKKERVEGLLDAIRMAVMNANAMPVTTSFFNGLRAKNLTIQNATAVQIGDTVFVTVTNSSSGSSGFQQPLSGALEQDTFTWTTAPNVLVIDGVPRQKVQSDGTVNWTGTVTTVLTGAPWPTFDIFSI